ncbi:MAG: phosphoribosylformylglycinamidine synthase subunit PurL [Deltaproteobacteria bacterium]|nr:phosphoribosylformylglycinamidine synthase subunit PurL [Deltaproteobacteria bacterium]MCB9788853.1 phosphoribosylformylglycinamidine synthase subunit PurL [Deltaproteobacteria bacterium]
MKGYVNHVPISDALVAEHGLSPDEYQRVLEVLGREPTLTELGIFSVMWSEHCSYKSSRKHLGGLPTSGPRVLQGPGENAGVVDVGGGWAVAFKMESHNHPSFIEPYQGAATGVGGIMRDVFTMGARPIASLNSLRFGRVDHPRTPYLVGGVVAGIGGYGNCMGVPTVGGEVTFDPSYDGNILVNAFNLGLLRADRIFRGYATGVGNPVIYVGAKTGRDGIHGATMASDTFDEGSEQKRPTVQVGDPFTEKLLLEACLELFATDLVIGIQDMGAAGLTSSSFEMASRAGTGLDLDLDAVPQRAADLDPYEMMLSESQERMLLVARAGREAEVAEIFRKWDLDAVVVGRVTDTGRVVVTWRGETAADIPVDPITELAPRYDRPHHPPADLESRWRLDLSAVADPAPGDEASARLTALLAAPNVASRQWIYRQYDHSVRVGTVRRPGDADAAVIRLPDGDRGVALTVDCNPRLCWLDPLRGAALAIVECCRNLACVGAEPLGTTDCLNFGNPERPEIMWELVQAIEGIGLACREMECPVVSGNVSLYNETGATAVKPTPSVAVVGLVEDVHRAGCTAFGRDDLEVALLGVLEGPEGGSLAGSVLLSDLEGRCAGRPAAPDFARERAVQGACRELVRTGTVASAHDLSEGGLAVALAEMCFGGPGYPQVGVSVHIHPRARLDQALFGEDGGRILIAYALDDRALVQAVAARYEAPLAILGLTGGDHLRITDHRGHALVDAPIATLHEAWRFGLERALGYGE